MAFCLDDDEGDGPPLRSEAEITLKKLLEKQLSTSARLEQVEFQQATESMHSLGHGSSGISSLSEFVKNELARKQLVEKTMLLQNVLHGMGYSKGRVQERCQNLGSISSSTSRNSDKGTKRARYGADPLFLSQSEAEDLQIASLEYEHKLKEEARNNDDQTNFGGHSKGLEALLVRGKDGVRAIAHLSGEGRACRKPLFSEADGSSKQLCMTPQERARNSIDNCTSRLADEVFSRPAPEVLELHDYLNKKTRIEVGSSADATWPEVVANEREQPATALHVQDPQIKEIPVEEIIKNRLSQDEIRKLPCGKFGQYSLGNPSHVLYIKNLSREVTEADLAALFMRYQGTQCPLLFRLMKRGRMKGQAFVTFPDAQTSSDALHLLNGYQLKGKPMVMEFGHGGNSSMLHLPTSE